MKDFVLNFFLTWGDVLRTCAALATAASAVTAVCVACKHWRDDDLNLFFVVKKKCFDDGTYRYWYVISIVNAGRHPVHFRSFSVRNGNPTAINLGTYSYPNDGIRRIAPGDSITVDTIVVTEHDDIIFPESAEIWCETSAKEPVFVTRIEFSDDCPAMKAKELASLSKLGITFDGRWGWAPGYR